MFKPYQNPYVPAEPFTSSPAFAAWLDVAAHGYPNADRVPLAMLLTMQQTLKDKDAKRLARNGG
jgi:hypothetical protein